MVVDDDILQGKVLSHLLGKLNYRIYTVRRGEDALAFLQEQHVDLLLLDVPLGDGIDGVETYRRVRREHPDQKTIVMTGLAGTKQLTELIRLGIKTWARKPLTPQMLANTIRQELDRREELTVRGDTCVTSDRLRA